MEQNDARCYNQVKKKADFFAQDLSLTKDRPRSLGVKSLLKKGERPMMSLIVRFLREEEGQTSTEYILLLAVVAMIVFKFRDTAKDRLESITNAVFNEADSLVDTIGN